MPRPPYDPRSSTVITINSRPLVRTTHRHAARARPLNHRRSARANTHVCCRAVSRTVVCSDRCRAYATTRCTPRRTGGCCSEELRVLAELQRSCESGAQLPLGWCKGIHCHAMQPCTTPHLCSSAHRTTAAAQYLYVLPLLKPCPLHDSKSALHVTSTGALSYVQHVR